MDPRGLVGIFLLVAGAVGLETPGDCSQPGLNCTIQTGGCLDSSWLTPSKWTPSPPKELLVNIAKQEDTTGISVPVLSIRWRLGTDASIKYSQGVTISVTKQNNGEEKCVQYRFNNMISSQVNPQGDKWTFSLERFVAEPEQTYKVSACSLPRANINQDNDCEVFIFIVPGCKDDRIKYTEICKRRGSIWNPNITHTISEMKTTIFFQAGKYANKYRVCLSSHGSDGKRCNQQCILKETEQKANVTFSTENWMQSCMAYNIEIQPFFIDCDNDCTRFTKKILMIIDGEPSPELPTLSTPGGPTERSWFFAATGVLVFVIIFGCTVWVQLKSKRNEMKPSHDKLWIDEPTVVHPELPQVKKKVLIIYSLDHDLYKNVVLAFAEFLMTACGTKVTLDLLEINKIAEVGHINWLTLHKNESDKVIILCSRGTGLKWEAMLRVGQNQILLRSDERSPMRDMFTPAMNLILPDFKRPASFGKYIVAYFDDISSEEDIPDPFNVGVKYKLMKQFEEIHFRVQDLEKYEPGKTYRVAGITMDDYHEHPSGKTLKDAVQKFKLLQMEQPDWFEKECIISPDEAGVEPNWNEEPCDLLSISQNVVRYKPLDDMPCTVNEVYMATSSNEALIKHPVGFEHRVQDISLSQNVIEVDCNEAQVLNPVYTLEPLYSMSLSGCSQNELNCPNFELPKAEEEPLLEKDWILRNDVIDFPLQSCEGDITVNEIGVHSGGDQVSCISHDVKKKLEEFQQMLFLQGLMSSQDSTRLSHLQSEVIGYPQSLSLEKEENVASDQGYSSKQSFSVGEVPSGVSISSEALDELQILQVALLNESMSN
ncbi:interleukin 17 receptor A1a [Carcharodon carcharias]|uniref:interleukin 17 receptor A1a n=1 Tax=Carcharodon carcharias TaxID=13397 RepID=UPI001B7DC7E4|nr:interleukin 17 receptor A1a [Carcharodon carcharias]